jgi:autotransporter-associated beta strand protein
LSNAANSFGGTATINGGTLKPTVAGALPNGIGVSIGSGGTLDSANIPLNISSLSGSGSLLLGGSTLTVNQSTNATFSGVIDGATAQVIKQGTGTLTLSGASTFGGGLTIQAGRIAASGTGAGSGGVTVGPAGGLQLLGNLTGPVTVNGALCHPLWIRPTRLAVTSRSPPIPRFTSTTKTHRRRQVTSLCKEPCAERGIWT